MCLIYVSEVFFIHYNLIHLFFITFAINFFVTLYFLYSIFEKLIFLNIQGSKLKIKNEQQPLYK